MDPLYWALILFGLGLILAAFELFLPTGGVLGILAATSVIASIAVSFRGGALQGSLFLLTSLVAVPAFIYAGIKVWPHTPIGRSILNEPPTEEEVRPENHRKQLVGRCGLTKTKMLPSGIVDIEGTAFDAITSGMAIEAGQPVRVVSASGNRLVVRPYDGPMPEDQSTESSGDGNLLSQPLETFGFDQFDDPLA